MFFEQFIASTAFGALSFYTFSVILYMAAAADMADITINPFFQDFEKWTLHNLFKMSISAAYCKSTGGPLASFSDQIWPR